jgi:periplasmic protein TonB
LCASIDLLGEDTIMSTTAFEVKGHNKTLFRTAAITGSAVIWGTLGYMALTYVPKFDRPKDDPTLTIVGVPPIPKPVPPKPEIKPPEPKNPIVRSDEVTAKLPSVMTTRTPKSATLNPLSGQLPAGPVSDAPVTFAPTPPLDQGREWEEPVVLATAPTLPPVVAAPPAPTAPRLVVNPIRISGANPVFPTRPLERGVSGEVTLSFTVSPTGTVENIAVTGEDPRGYGFARSAREAIAGWTFQPQTIDGVPVAYPARYTISFKLED